MNNLYKICEKTFFRVLALFILIASPVIIISLGSFVLLVNFISPQMLWSEFWFAQREFIGIFKKDNINYPKNKLKALKELELSNLDSKQIQQGSPG